MTFRRFNRAQIRLENRHSDQHRLIGFRIEIAYAAPAR
jgi:hypothetical protein